MDLALMVVLRPLIYLVLFAGVIYWVMRLVWKVLPDSKFKRFIFDSTLQERHPWKTGLFRWAVFFAILVAAALSRQ